MLAAAELSVWQACLIVAIIAFFAGLVWGIFRGLRWFEQKARASQEQMFEDLEIYHEPTPGTVAVVYHTYYGFLITATQTEHRIWASPEHAREGLNRMLRFNLTWGMISRAMLFVPLLAYGNFLSQRGSISRQARDFQ